MTVKELFTSVGFEAVAEALKNTHRKNSSITSLAGYKEAFDTICNMEFDGEGGEVTFEVTPREHWFDPGNLPMLALNVEGDYWENTVGKTVIKPEDNPFTDAELAGAILWGMTFYGFTRHDMWSPFVERFTRYGKMAERLERKLYLPYIRDKRVKRKLKGSDEMPHGLTFTQEVWKRIHHNGRHSNGCKRKRLHRIRQRIAELGRLDKRQNLIENLVATTGIDKERIADSIINAGSIRESWRESHAYGKTPRMDYLADLIANYHPTLDDLCAECQKMIIAVYTTPDEPLTEEERRLLLETISPVLAKRGISAEIAYGNEDDDDIRGEVSLMIIGISDSKPEDDD